jgi:hypothetical protein
VDIIAHGANFVTFDFSVFAPQTLDALEFIPSPRVNGVFILNYAVPFQGAIIKLSKPSWSNCVFQKEVS